MISPSLLSHSFVRLISLRTSLPPINLSHRRYSFARLTLIMRATSFRLQIRANLELLFCMPDVANNYSLFNDK